jgi:hypothetical protein
MNSARTFLCFSVQSFTDFGQDLLQQKLESVKYLAANSSESGDEKCEGKRILSTLV